MDIISNILKIVVFVVSVVLTFVVAFQSSKAEGLGSIGGGANLFFAKNKGLEGFLDRMTLIFASLFFVLVLAIRIMAKYYQ
ncbi:MAG: preprotein translocase subunit SecG [Bacillota bacterium]